MKSILVILAAITSAAVLHAEETAVSKSTWSGEAELGYLSTTGNTDTESLHAKGKVINEREKWKHTGTLLITNKNDRGATTAKRLYVTGKSDYKVNDLSYLFIAVSYEDDKFSGYEYQITEALGYGYHVIRQEAIKLDLEAGPGARQSKLGSGESSSEGIIKGAAEFEWNISKTATFNQHLSVEVGEDNTVSRSVTALKMQIIGNFAAKFSYSIKRNSNVPVGIKKTDTESVITLVYNF